ncbi:cell wall-binding repeat-containing protein [Gorillibacterium sp. sgz500922]|uniref:cell wall-binding repeat-containing protein n=1 Tax=Gorillibacterium sp. sgz500922 TaxID=3446694 RepID=UPI003F66CC21
MNRWIKLAAAAALAAGSLAGCSADKASGRTDSANSATPATAAAAPWLATKNTTRIQSSDPVQAAVWVSQTLWPALSKASRPASVVLTDSADWRIAAASADLIHHPSNGPVLYLGKNEVPAATLAELKRLNPLGAEGNRGVQAVIVGDVGDQVKEELKQAGFKTDQIPGSDPAEVARAVDRYYANTAGELPQSVIVASSEQAEYTLPAVNWIAHMPEPLLYVGKDDIPAATAEALKERGGRAHIYLLGPESVVSAKVADALKEYGTVVRIAGNDPYQNAVAFASYKDAATGFGWGISAPGHNLSFVAEGQPELAIAAAPFSHLGKHAPLLLTDKGSMPDAVMKYVMSLEPKFKDSPAEGPYNHAWITGDAASITPEAQDEIDQMLEIVPANGMDQHSGH